MANMLGLFGIDDEEEEEEEFNFLMEELANDEDEEAAVAAFLQGGRVTKKRRIYIDREHAKGHAQIMKDYFDMDCTYSDRLFRRRFRMRRELFLQIVERAKEDRYFQQRRDAVGHVCLSTLQKVVAAFRQLTYGSAADSVDDYVRIGETTALQCLKNFCAFIVREYKAEYLRQPTATEIDRIYTENAKRGFPGMIGSIDCMHWGWKNCPVGWEGAYQGKEKETTVILEAVATHDLRIWHAFFGTPGALNDISVLNRSDVLQNMPKASFEVNGSIYRQPYYLADGIYPSWPVFVKTIANPQDEMKSHFAKVQEAVRKDVERCFGVLQARFGIIKQPCRLWGLTNINSIMGACIIMHNMVVEDERELGEMEAVAPAENRMNTAPRGNLPEGYFLRRCLQQRNEMEHFLLRNDLVEHLWREHTRDTIDH